MMNNRKSFTLAELSVVATIMIILSTMAIVTLAPARAKTRDVRRRAEFETLKTALNWYWYDKRVYPTWSFAGCLEKTSSDLYPAAFSDPSAGFLGTWIERMPKDPLYGKGYCYYYKTDANGTNYHLIAKMEKDITAMENDGGLFNNYYEVFVSGGSELELINTSSTEVTAAMGQ